MLWWCIALDIYRKRTKYTPTILTLRKHELDILRTGSRMVSHKVLCIRDIDDLKQPSHTNDVQLTKFVPARGLEGGVAESGLGRD